MQGYRVRTEAPQLTKNNKYDAGLDVYSNEIKVVPARGKAIVSTDLYLAVPEGCVGLLWSRSGLSAKSGIEVGAGCVDAGYRGEVKVVLYNHSDVDYTAQRGDKIAQLLTVPVVITTYEEVDSLDDTSRGEKGFGSSGK